MPKINYEDYDALTVADLKDMAEQEGVDIPHDARKAEIIDALRAAEPKEEPSSPEAKESPEGKNVYEQQMSSTETALISNEGFWKIKLHS